MIKVSCSVYMYVCTIFIIIQEPKDCDHNRLQEQEHVLRMSCNNFHARTQRFLIAFDYAGDFACRRVLSACQSTRPNTGSHSSGSRWPPEPGTASSGPEDTSAYSLPSQGQQPVLGQETHPRTHCLARDSQFWARRHLRVLIA